MNKRGETIGVLSGLGIGVLLALLGIIGATAGLGYLLVILVLALIPLAGMLVVMERARSLFATIGFSGASLAQQGVGHRPVPKADWLSRAVLSGFIASMAMLFTFGIAYGIALMLGQLVTGPQSTNSQILVTAWFFNLAHNRLTDLAQGSLFLTMGAHFTVGLVLAALYAMVAEPRLYGPAWLRGLVYSVVPWLLSLVVFFPLIGGGPFGVALGAGPLPFLGNLILHLVYGMTLGTLYGPLGDMLPGVEEASGEENQGAMRHAERASALGIVGGIVMGLVAGIGRTMVIPPDSTFMTPPLLDVLGLTLLGGSLGALLGSLFGLPSSDVVAPAHREG